MTFRVNQKVECVDDSLDVFGRPIHVTKGEKYTVAGVFDFFGRPAILLAEVFPGEDGSGWFASRFRPIVEPKTEISFTTGADPSSDQFDNRRKVRKKVTV